MVNDNNDYPICIGLQKPLEFMGVRGRFLIWIAAFVGVGMLGTLIMMIIGSTILGFLFLIIVAGSGYIVVRIKQKQGLHNKKKANGVFVYHNLFSVRK